ncbi:MAG: ribosome-associated translation inhibitor RaiA [Bacteroidota bacterium]|nr:ribosome-associated translation inhibitor RaiA [Bacteroidota bacterium]
MDIQIHSIHFDADKDLLSFIKFKLNKLITFNDSIISADVFLKIEKNNEMENKLVDIKIKVPGKELFAKRQAISFEAAVDEVTEALRRQVVKAHG